MLVVPQLGPGVGKENEQRADLRMGRQYLKKEPGFRLDEMEVGQLRTIAFSDRPLDPFANQVDAHALLITMGRGIGGEEMPMSAAHLENERAPRRKNSGELLLEGKSTLLDDGKILRRIRHRRHAR